MRNNTARTVASILSSLIATGCGSTPEHTNTLLFGTTTKFALDISVNPAGGTPDFTLGFKRHEGVWMPLLANQGTGNGRQPGTCQNCSFQGNKDTDTYSVLASFGATFGGTAATSDVDANPSNNASGNGGLAQFFATGLAARKLAEHGNSRLVAIQPTDYAQLKDAQERAKKSEENTKSVEKRMIELLGSNNYINNKAGGLGNSSLLIARKNIIVSTVAPGGKFDEKMWISIVEKSSLDDSVKSTLKTATELKTIDDQLTIDASMSGSKVNALYEVVK